MFSIDYNHLKWEYSTIKQHELKKKSTILALISWDILLFYQIFFSPQVKRIVITSNKHGMCELPHDLPNNLRLRILEN